MEDNCDILFTGSHLFTAQGNEQQIIRNGALAVKDNIIVWLGEQSQLPERYKNPKKAYYELDQGWLTPGLIDCHTHLIYGGNRSDEFRKRMQGQSYEEIARQGGGILAELDITQANVHQCLQLTSDHWLRFEKR